MCMVVMGFGFQQDLNYFPELYSQNFPEDLLNYGLQSVLFLSFFLLIEVQNVLRKIYFYDLKLKIKDKKMASVILLSHFLIIF